MSANVVTYPTQQERILAKLGDPRTADALERLLDKLDVVAFGVEAIDSFMRRSEEVADSLSASIQEMKGMNGADRTAADFVYALPQLARTGIQVAAATQRPGFQNLMDSGLIDRLGDPKTIENIQTVLSKLEIVAFALTAIDGFAKRGDEITDSVRESLEDVRGLVGSLDFAKLKPLVELLDHLPGLLASGVMEQLPELTKLADVIIKSGVATPENIAALTQAAKTVSDSYDAAKRVPPRQIGIFGLLRELKDPDVNRSVTLALEFAKQYGKRIE
jgi:hypothetical protein